jgi:hypothetical protein
MSRTKKEKVETHTGASLQIVTKNATEERINAADDYIEVALEKRRKEANQPLYLKRV